MKDTKLCLVIPCYNEEEVLPETLSQLRRLLDSMIAGGAVSKDSKIVCVDDGSKDRTWQIIAREAGQNSCIEGIKLSGNRGHQNALLAGLMSVRTYCDCCISIDADLQDDIRVIPKFVQKFDQGIDVVYGVRSRRETDTRFKRLTAKIYYRILRMLGADIIENHADFRLMSQRALDALAEFPEVNLFLRGMVKLVGFPSDVVYYERGQRFAGESKYPLKRMLSFGIDGVSSFSIKPIRMVLGLGMFVCVLAILAAVYAFCAKFFGVTVTGWTSLMITIWFLGGVQLVSIGVIGEYVGKIYKEVKRRPRYIIEENTLEKSNQKP